MTVDNGYRPRFGDDGSEPTPSVAMPARRWVVPLGVLAALALGALVFWQLSANRTRVDAARLTDPAPNSQPIVGMNDVPPPPDVSTLGQATLAVQTAAPLISEAVMPPAPDQALAQAEADQRFRSPSLIVDLSEATRPPDAATTTGGPGLSAAGVSNALGGGSRAAMAQKLNPDEQFAERLGVGDPDGPARARRMSNQGFTVVQGAVIPAVLETAINSDLPGYVRAIVSRDVRSFDGANVLVPRGSRLVGQYKSGVALGQSRAFVIWTRLIRPDGVGVELAAPGTDALGRGGLEGKVDRHFLQRFGGAILLSLITAGAQIAANDSSDTQVIIAATRGPTTDAASVALQSDSTIAPTVKVPQGAPIRIFVTRDLDFSVLDEPQ
jgi:type IV secretory pathway VirB10-like protein